MPLLFRRIWNANNPHHAGADDVPMKGILGNTELRVRAIIFEAWRAGGFTDGVIAGMLLQANAERGRDVVVREGLHQVEAAGEHGDGFNLHIGTAYNGNNFHLNVHQTASGRPYVSSVSYGNNANRVVENRVGPPPA